MWKEARLFYFTLLYSLLNRSLLKKILVNVKVNVLEMYSFVQESSMERDSKVNILYCNTQGPIVEVSKVILLYCIELYSAGV